jgi:signal transduction histidine kinase/ligand-binding sensor domain-containing protein
VPRISIALITALAFLVCPSARAATVVSGEYSITSWTDEDGLPLSQIWALAQTRDGFLWLATTAGLVRFDGQTFKVGVAGVPEGEVTTVCASRDGSLWIALNSGAVSRLASDGTVVTYGPEDGLAAGRVTELLEDRSGTLWVGAPGGLFRFRDGRWEAVGSTGAVTSLYEDRNGTLLIGTSRSRVLALEPGSSSFVELQSPRTVNSFSEDPSGGLWVNDSELGYRLLRGPSGSRVPRTGLAGEQGYRLLHDGNGDMWVATSFAGLIRVPGDSPTASTVQHFMTGEGLAHNVLRALLRDRDGNIWIGTLAGLSRVSKSVFSLAPGPVGPGSVNSLSVGRNGTVWVATTHGLIRYAGGTRTVFDTRDGLPSSYVIVAEEDANGVLWIGTARGLARYAGGRFEPVRLPDGSGGGFVRTLTFDGYGAMWFWGADRELTKLQNGAFTEVDTPTADRGYLSLTDSSGRVWFAFTNNNGLVRLSDGEIRRYAAGDGLGSGRVNALTESDGVLWVATNVGLSRSDGDRFVTLDRRRLPGTAMSVVVDRDGFVWLGIGSGFVRLAISEYEKALADPKYAIQFSFYDSSDGAPGPPVYALGRGSVRGPDGSLWFATRGSVAVIEPGRVPVRRQPPVARIEGVGADQQVVAPASAAQLPPRVSRVQFDYVALSLSSSWVRFRYMLEGFDEGWIDAGTSRQAVYTNLRPGDYRFRVEASNKDGMWSEPALWAFSVAPAFYETGWFYAGAALALALMVWTAWQLRLRSVHHRLALVFAERTRVAREIHDTLLQSLVGVAWQLDSIRERPEASPDDMRHQLSTLRTRMEGFIREARESIWNLRSPALAEHDLPSALREAGEALTSGSDLRFTLDVSGQPRRLSPRVEQQLLRIGQEAVTNAVRHASASVVRMELSYGDDSVLLRVSDDGRGFDPAVIVRNENNHWGLKSMEERMQEIGGHLSLVSRAGEGTTLEARAPLTTAA